MKSPYLAVESWITAGILATAMVGCGRPKATRAQPSTKIEVESEAAPSINRDAHGEPLSVVVRIYYLKDGGEFSRLTFDLATSGRSDQELLGADFLGRSELVVVPGTTALRTAELAPGTRYLGVVAFFRKPDPHHWRCLVSREQLIAARAARRTWKNRKQPFLSFRIQDCYMTLNHCRPEPIPGQPAGAKPECGEDTLDAPPSDRIPARPAAPPARPAGPSPPRKPAPPTT